LALKTSSANDGAKSVSAFDLKHFAHSGSTTFNNLTGSVSMYHGILKLNNFVFSTLKSTGSASGVIDIYKQNINLLALFDVGQHSQGESPVYLKLNVSDNLFSPNNTLELYNNTLN
jgi:hypothetical protein